ncbi:MAG: hypothetical protein ACYCSB_04200 [bacterium]
MAIKKSKEEWAREPIAGRNEIKDRSQKSVLKSRDEGKHQATETKVPYAVRMPESLYLEVKDYLERYGRRGESINEMFVAGMRKELKERMAFPQELR